jgi:hypothetical protein
MEIDMQPRNAPGDGFEQLWLLRHDTLSRAA